MPKDKVVLSLVSIAFGIGLTLFVSNLRPQGDQAAEVGLASTNILESSVPENEALESPAGRTVRREPDLERILKNLGYERVFVYHFQGGFLGADLFDIDGKKVSLGGYWPTIGEAASNGRIICLIQKDGMAKLNWQLETKQEGFSGWLTQCSSLMRVYDREKNSDATKYKTGGELTGFDESTGALLAKAFEGLRNSDGKKYPPGFTIFTYGSDPRRGLKVEDARTILGLRWLDKDESATSSN